MRCLLLATLVAAAHACSHFTMKFPGTGYRFSGRSNDGAWPLGTGFGAIQYDLHAFPSNRTGQRVFGMTWTALYGYVGVTISKVDGLGTDFPLVRAGVLDGLNERGLSCAMQTLHDSKFQRWSPNVDRDLVSLGFCKWALELFGTIDEVNAGLENVHVVLGLGGILSDHFILADASGRTLVVEFTDGKRHSYIDENDNGKTGYGVCTNSPTFPWQVEAVRNLEWKRQQARAAVAVPGGWYPDERFQRLWLVKSPIESSPHQPKSTQAAVALTTAVLNTVTVPPEGAPATDTSKAKPGYGDYSQFQCIRDHADATYYFRTVHNPSLRRVRLADAGLRGDRVLTLAPLDFGPWYTDVAADLK